MIHQRQKLGLPSNAQWIRNLARDAIGRSVWLGGRRFLLLCRLLSLWDELRAWGWGSAAWLLASQELSNLPRQANNVLVVRIPRPGQVNLQILNDSPGA